MYSLVLLANALNSEVGYFPFSAGLQVWDRPHTSLADFTTTNEAVQKMPSGPDKDAAMKALGQEGFSPERVTIGKLRNKSATIVLSDGRGRPRIRMSLAENGNPTLAFLDETGKVTHTLP